MKVFAFTFLCSVQRKLGSNWRVFQLLKLSQMGTHTLASRGRDIPPPCAR
jgi:hypothetical protein